jgi:hypothetical protein
MLIKLFFETGEDWNFKVFVDSKICNWILFKSSENLTFAEIESRDIKIEN